MYINNLQRAGYDLNRRADGDDILTLEQWSDLGRLKAALEPPQFCPMFMKKKD
jgi:hypothetical protein